MTTTDAKTGDHVNPVLLGSFSSGLHFPFTPYFIFHTFSCHQRSPEECRRTCHILGHASKGVQ